MLAVMTPSADARAHRHHRMARPVLPYAATRDLAEPVQAALAAAKAGRRVIVVFDIDNTLLTTPQDLGGDAWFAWQKSKGADVDSLIADNTLLLEATRMQPTQPDTAALVGDLQGRHIAVYALSARGETLRGATEAALHDNGIDLSPAPECGPPLCTRRGNLADTQVRAAERRLGMSPQAQPYHDVSVSDGIMLVSGQDKGVMLHLLLASLGRRFDDVFFVDDTLQNVQAVEAAAPTLPARLHAYSYQRFWDDAAAFSADAARQQKAQDDLAGLKVKLCAAVRSAVCARP